MPHEAAVVDGEEKCCAAGVNRRKHHMNMRLTCAVGPIRPIEVSITSI